MANFESGCGLVRAAAEGVLGPVAVAAKHLEAWREALQFQPVIQSATASAFTAMAQFPSMPRSIVGDMVNRQKHLIGKMAAGTFAAAIDRQYLRTKLAAVSSSALCCPSWGFCRSAYSASNIKLPANAVPPERFERLDAFAFRASPLAAGNGQLLPSPTWADLVPSSSGRSLRAEAREASPRRSPLGTKLTGRLSCRARATPAHPWRKRHGRELRQHATQPTPPFLPLPVTRLAIRANPPRPEKPQWFELAAVGAPTASRWPFWSSTPHQRDFASTQSDLLIHAVMLIHADSIVKADNDG